MRRVLRGDGALRRNDFLKDAPSRISGKDLVPGEMFPENAPGERVNVSQVQRCVNLHKRDAASRKPPQAQCHAAEVLQKRQSARRGHLPEAVIALRGRDSDSIRRPQGPPSLPARPPLRRRKAASGRAVSGGSAWLPGRRDSAPPALSRAEQGAAVPGPGAAWA